MAEINMLHDQWKKEEDVEKEAEWQKLVLNRARNHELIRHNAAEKELREIQKQAEKEMDKAMLEKNLERDRILHEIEEAEKAERRKEVIELQQYYKQMQNDKTAHEKEVDKFVEEEAERQFKIRDVHWQREQ